MLSIEIDMVTNEWVHVLRNARQIFRANVILCTCGENGCKVKTKQSKY